MKKIAIILSIFSLAGLVAFSIPVEKPAKTLVVEDIEIMEIEDFQTTNDGVFDFDEEAE